MRRLIVVSLVGACSKNPQPTSLDASAADAAPHAPTLATRWALELGGTGEDAASSVALDAASNVIAVGTFEGTVDFGDRSATAPGLAEAWLSKRAAADGAAIWTRTFGNEAGAAVTDVAVEQDDSIVVGGSLRGDVDVGGQVLHAPTDGTAAAFVAKYDPDGNLVWATLLDVGGVSGVATSPDGHVAVEGAVVSTLHAPNGTVTFPNGAAFIMLLDTTGTPLWGYPVADASSAVVSVFPAAIAMTPMADIVASGSLIGGGGVIENTTLTPNGDSAWLARVDVSGQLVWATTVGASPDYLWCTGLAIMGEGTIYTTAENQQNVSPFTDRLRLDASTATGAPLWTASGVSGDATLTAVTALSDGRVVVAGYTSSASVDFGVGKQTGYQFVATYDSTGAFEVAQMFGASDDGSQELVRLASRASVVVGAGTTGGPIDYGTGLLQWHGAGDATLVMYDVLP
jgi:hypothetical protein